mmetsp:Transcript_5061/g.7046  ORF Transcript_5061/g.7046 Transcript_5061/m.7046 type:complete len:82 (+) Transcript_5061:942-1187(+)
MKENGKRTPKHVDISLLDAQEQEKWNRFKFEYVPTEKQIADAMTKSPCCTLSEKHRGSMGLTSVDKPAIVGPNRDHSKGEC